MAKNLIPIVENIRTEYNRSMPDGMTEKFLKEIPHLFKRIEQLERALIPFARAFNNNAQFEVDMLQVYKTDCRAAFDQLDSQNGVRPPAPPVEYPA